MKKILVWNSFDLKKRNGGPPTYLYNLREGLKSINNFEVKIFFLSDLLNQKSLELNNNKSKIKNKIFDFLGHKFPTLINNIRLLKYLKFIKEKSDDIGDLNLDEFETIHFHISIDVYRNRNILKGYKGNIYLSSHSPKPFWLETIEDVYGIKLKNVLSFFKKSLEAKDIWSFIKADFLIFPCEEALEPYLKWEKYNKEVHVLNKYKYVTSGIPSVDFKLGKNEVRKTLNIPDDAIVFSYIGRHSEIKGYDLLLKLGEELLTNYKNIYFLIAGKEFPLKGLNHKRWIEIGWTNDPHSYVNASDVFILPNRETYFDLVLLEVLSLGLTTILSETGGNLHFKKHKNAEIYFFENNNLESLIIKAKETISNKEQLRELRKVNKDIFEENYSLNPFVKKSIKLYKE